jgi:hypothetical protein
MQSGARLGRLRRSNDCSTCRSMIFTRSCHGRLANLTRSGISVLMQATRVVFTICLKAVLDGRLGREAARERVLEELEREGAARDA